MPTPQPYGPSDMSIYTTQNYASPVTATPTSALNFDQRNSYSSTYSNGSGSTHYSPASQYSHDYRYGPMHHNSNGYPPSITPISAFHDRQSDYMGNPYGPDNNMSMSIAPSTGGMYTRNLIGNLSASAFRLQDLNKEDGIWFVLQDLSVRTEGWFRLKFTFVNLHRSETAPEAGDGESPLVVAGSSAPVLASVFSKPFHVWSAKRFPGVIESTALSRHFAGQGIKIPIRKEGRDGDKKKKKRRNGEDEEEEDEEEEEDYAKVQGSPGTKHP